LNADEHNAVRELSGLYEPSAIVQLPDGRFLAVEDEKQHPFALLRLLPDGRFETRPLLPPGNTDEAWKFDDLEGLTLDPAGQVCAITSHSRTGDGEEKKARNKLLRFRVVGDAAVDLRVCRDLKAALTAAYPLLAAADQAGDPKAQGGLNIEALEFSANGHALLLGFRSPQRDGQALVASIENPQAVFSVGAQPRLAPALLHLDLGGQGIRALSWVPVLGGYLLVAGPASREREAFTLWYWDGHAAPRRASVTGLADVDRVEGICPAQVQGRQLLLMVRDDGDRITRQPASCLLLDPAQLYLA
jgi:hypothetical protein